MYTTVPIHAQEVWQSTDIGSVGHAGSVDYQAADETFTVRGGGADIWNTADAFHFVHIAMTGDGQIVARVTDVANTDPWAKGAIMMRENLSASARYADMVITPERGLAFQHRVTPGGNCDHTPTDNLVAPHWLRLVRRGNQFSGHYSTDGIHWTLQQQMEINMAAEIYTGLAVTAHNNSALCTATFERVEIGRPCWQWLFDEPGGAAVLEAGGHLNASGTLNASVTRNGGVHGAGGLLLALNGSLVIPNAQGQILPAAGTHIAPFSISFWFKPRQLTDGQMQLLLNNETYQQSGFRCGIDYGYYLGVGHAPALCVWATESGGSMAGVTTYSRDTVIEPNQWYHAVVTHDGMTTVSYLNGEVESVDLGFIVANTNNLVFGANSTGHPGFQGDLSDLKIYSGVLGPSEVAAEYQVDTDGHGLPDWWQWRYFGSLGVNPSADPDDDGWTNLQEYQRGSVPTDYYSQGDREIVPVLGMLGGDNQTGRPLVYANEPLTVRVTDSVTGLPIAHAPVTFAVVAGDGALGLLNSVVVQTHQQLTLRTALDGTVQVWVRSGWENSVIQATAGRGWPLRFSVNSQYLLGHWNFDQDTATEARDFSGLGHHAVKHGGLAVAQGPDGGTAYDFDGTSAYLGTTIPNQQAASLVAWICPRSSQPVTWIESVFDCDVPGSYGTGWGLSDGHIRVILNNQFWDTGVPVQLGQWQHVALVYDASSAKLYVNGEPRASLAYTRQPMVAANYLIGRSNANPLFFNGQMDDARIYHGTLSDAQVMELYMRDEDHNGLPDWWEMKYFGRLGLSHSALAPGGNGSTILENFINGTDPNDYYSQRGGVVTPVVTLVSGNQQSGVAGSRSAEPLVVRVADGAGRLLANAPVVFKTLNSQAGLLSGSAGQGQTANTLTVRTDANGEVRSVFYIFPAGTNGGSQVEVTAGASVAVVFVFNGSVLSAPPAAGLRLWLKADSGLTYSGTLNQISQWQDASGNNNHATQTSASYQPTLATVNGRVGVKFEASKSHRLNFPSGMMSGVTASEMFVVLRADTAIPSSSRYAWNFYNTGYYPTSSGGLQDGFGSNSNRSIGTPVADITQWHMYNVSAKAGQWISWLNGQVQYRSDSNTVTFTTSTYLGNYFDGQMAEIIIYDRVLSDEERTVVAEYLNLKHQLGGLASPIAPTELLAYAIGSEQVGLNWKSDGNAWMRYEIERKEGTGAYVKIGESRGTHDYVDVGLKAGVEYRYRVRTVNSIGASGYSNEVAITLTGGSNGKFAREGMRLWLKTDGLAEGLIGTWRDQSGLGNNAIQTSGTSYYPMVVKDVNNKTGVKFMASKSHRLNLQSGFMSGVTASEMFVVLKADTVKPPSNRYAWYFYNTCYYPMSSGALQDGFGSNSNRSMGTPVADITQWHVYNVSAKAGQWICRLNGQVQYRSDSNTVTFTTSTYLGDYFDGQIAEIIIYDRVLSDEERVGMEMYLSLKHQLGGVNVPVVPTDLTVYAIGSEQVGLNWKSDNNAWVKYEIERKENHGVYLKIGENNRALDYVDTGLKTGVEYSYRVRAVNSIGASGYSNEVTIILTGGNSGKFTQEGMRLWLKADGLTEGLIGAWHDQSGLGNNAIQTSGTSYCPMVVKDVNSKTGVKFVASKSHKLNLQSGFMSGVTASEMFVVLKADVARPSSNRYAWYFYNTCYYPMSGGALQDGFGSNSNRNMGTPVADITQWHVYNVSAKAGQWISRLNGQIQSRSDSNTVTFTTSTYLGDYFDGQIAEIIIYDRVLSNDERIGMETYLSLKHQLGGTITPSAPTELLAYAIGSEQVGLNWKSDGNAWVRYEIERKEGTGVYVKIGESRGTHDYVDVGLKTGVEYKYRIRAVNSVGASSYSNEVAITLVDGSSGKFARDGMRLWLKADGLTEGLIGAWCDQSGLGNNAIQTSGTTYYPIVVKEANNKTGVKFEANKSHKLNLQSGFMNGVTASEMFVVLKADAARPSSNRYAWYFYNTCYYPMSSGALQDGFGSNSNRNMGTPVADITQWHMYNVSAKAGQWISRLNGQIQYQSASNTVTFTNSPYLGDYFDGQMAEIIIYDRVLSDEERIGMQNYLGQKYQMGMHEAPVITIQQPSTITLINSQTFVP